MKITLETIPHEQQRYETAGDWFFDEEQNLTIRVSDTGDWRFNAMVAVHELIEVLLCKARGITQEQVDIFDLSYKGEGEPGDEPNAPYQNEHNFATSVERMLCAAFNIPWAEYDGKLEQL